MSLESVEFMRRARRAEHQASASSRELRSVFKAIQDAYELLAHVQEILDDREATYRPPTTH